jgi:sugar (pentulose or hexulose) kinase
VVRWQYNQVALSEYIPFLMGSRYSLEALKAGFTNLTQNTTREEMLVAMVRSLCSYQRNHLDELDQKISLSNKIFITGGAVNEAIIEAKRRWYRTADYCFTEQSSMKGAAKLAAKYVEANSL